MTGGYLQRLVDSGTASLRDVRGSIGPPRARDDEEGPHVPAAEPPAGGETSFAPSVGVADRPVARFGPAGGDDARDARAAAPGGGLDRVTRPDIGPIGGDPAAGGTVRVVSQAVTSPRRGADAGTASSVPAAGGAPLPSLRDADIRSVTRPGAVHVPAPARQARSVPFDAIAPPVASARRTSGVPADRGLPVDDAEGAGGGVNRAAVAAAGASSRSAPPRVAPAQVEQWQRLKDRLILEHFPGAAAVPAPAGTRHASQAAGTTSRASGNERASGNASGNEIVIDQLEVVIAAPAAPAPPAPSTPRARSGAWSVAARRYLGKL